MLVADLPNSAQQRFEAVLGARRGSDRSADIAEPAGFLLNETEAAELLRQVASHGFLLQPGRFQPVTLNRHPKTPGERLHVIEFAANNADNMKAAAAMAANLGRVHPHNTSEHFVVIIFTDRENGTSIILNASAAVMLSTPTVPS